MSVSMLLNMLFIVMIAGGLSLTRMASGMSGFEVQAESKSGLLKATLVCDEAPNTQGFQHCLLLLNTSAWLPSAGVEIKIDGGMPAHRHGLPTAPVVSTTGRPGEYNIEGLKFSMPGGWLLGFKVVDQKRVEIIKFSLDVVM